MNYDVVLCTRNRPKSARSALEHLERQTVRPRRVVLVDASDDHESALRVMMAGRDESIEWVTLESTVRNLPYQRNLGLSQTSSAIALMPDDDSMLYPNAAEEILEVYRRDEAGQIGAVSAIASLRHPTAGARTQLTTISKIKGRLEPIRHRIELRTMPKPHLRFPRSLWRDRAIPPWIDGDRFAMVETVSGFLMSVRADAVRDIGFDPTLGYGIGYALHEDMEMCMRLQRAGYLLVAAHRAPVFHDLHPSARAGGFSYGFCWLANYAYACSRDMRGSSYPWRKEVERFLRYKLMTYRLRAATTRGQYAKEVARGAQAAWGVRASLLDCEVDELEERYKSLCDQHLS